VATINQGGQGQPVYVEFPFDLILDFKFGGFFAVLTVTTISQVSVGHLTNSVTIPQSKGGFAVGDRIPYDTSVDSWKTPVDPVTGLPQSPGIDNAQVIFADTTGIDLVYTPPTGKTTTEPPSYNVFLEAGDSPERGTITTDGQAFYDQVLSNYQAGADFGASVQAGFASDVGTTTFHGSGITVTTVTTLSSAADIASLFGPGISVINTGYPFGLGVGSHSGLQNPPVSVNYKHDIWGRGPDGFFGDFVQDFSALSSTAYQQWNPYAEAVSTSWLVLKSQTSVTDDAGGPEFSSRQVYLFAFDQMTKDLKGKPSAGPNNDPTLVTLFQEWFQSFTDPTQNAISYANQYQLQLYGTAGNFYAGPQQTIVAHRTDGTPIKPIYDVTKTVPWNQGAPFELNQVLQFNAKGWVKDTDVVPITP
jgi:hypothetical protein